VTVTTVQHVPVAETSAAVTTAHHAVIVTHVHHSVTVTTVQHVDLAQAAETSVAVMIAHHVQVAMIVQHVDHVLIPAAAAQLALVAHQPVAKNQHVVTSPLVQSARLNQ
jgi:hypothetical protein